MSGLATGFRDVRFWLAARRQRGRIQAAAQLVKSGKLEAGIAMYEDVLPRLLNSKARASVLRPLFSAALRQAGALRRSGDRERAEVWRSRAIALLKGELAAGPLSAARKMAFLHAAAEQLAADRAAGWIRGMREPAASALAVSPVERIESIAEGTVPPPPSAELRDLLVKAETFILPAAWWLVVHNRLYRLGEAGAAIDAKRAAARAVLADNDRVSAEVGTRLAAAVYLGDRDRINSLSNSHIAFPVRRDVLLAVGELDAAREIDAVHRSPADRAFARALEGKVVAVVGPAENTLRNGPAIDSHDFVARTNFVANESFRSRADMLGARTSAVYYNSIFLDGHAQEIAATLRSGDIGYAMARSFPERVRIRRQAWGQRTRHYHFTPAVFMARGYAMRHVLNDLALMPVKSITCFGADFFLGEKSHFPGYQERNFDRIRSSIVHDPLDCWRFMRSLAQAGVMQADAILDALLKLDEEAFIAALDRRIGGESP